MRWPKVSYHGHLLTARRGLSSWVALGSCLKQPQADVHYKVYFTSITESLKLFWVQMQSFCILFKTNFITVHIIVSIILLIHSPRILEELDHVKQCCGRMRELKNHRSQHLIATGSQPIGLDRLGRKYCSACAQESSTISSDSLPLCHKPACVIFYRGLQLCPVWQDSEMGTLNVCLPQVYIG